MLSQYEKRERELGTLQTREDHLAGFDEIDRRLLAKRIEAWNCRTEPRVGDFIIMPDGELRRLTHNWLIGLQTTWKGEGGTFYLSTDGYGDYSGGLDSQIPNDKIENTGETREGNFWFFHHDNARAHNGITVKVPCRVYRVRP